MVRVAARSTYKRASGLGILKFSVFHTRFKSIFLPRRASSAKRSSKKKECVFVGKKEAMAQFAGINNLWSKLTDEQENANGLRKYRVSNVTG